MEKVLVEVFLPASNQSYDIFIPQTIQMGEVVQLVSKSLSELSGGKYKTDPTAILCDRKTGKVFNINASVYELQIKNGSELVLI